MGRFKQMGTQIRSFFVKDWQLKLLAILLALVSFYAIRETTSFQVHYDIPLEVDVSQKGITVLEQSDQTVRVTFRGSQEDVDRLDPKRIKAVVEPTVGDPFGLETLTIGRGSIKGAAGVMVQKLEPQVVTVSFDREVEKKFPVAKPRTRGKPLRGKVELTYEPNVVLVRGSAARLEQVKKGAVETEPVDIDGRVKSFTTKARVLPPIHTGSWQIKPEDVTVNVSIVTETMTREWTNVMVSAIRPSSAPDIVELNPATVTVSLVGQASVMRDLSVEQITVFVDTTGRQAWDEVTLPVRVHLPARVEASVSVEPEKVKAVLVSRRDAETE